ncbi:MAG: hypothetical protein ACUVXD_07785, partial [Thermodesulfobacteriota bacterium]
YSPSSPIPRVAEETGARGVRPSLSGGGGRGVEEFLGTLRRSVGAFGAALYAMELNQRGPSEGQSGEKG